MKLYRFAIATLMAVTALIGQSCSSADEALPKEIQGYALLSRSDAQAQLDELIVSNVFLDLDLANYVPSPTGQQTEYEVYQRAIFYRFFQKTRIENNRIVVDGTAADINVSERVFNYCKRGVVEMGNSIIDKFISMGYTPEEAVRKTYHVTPESIKRIRHLY